MDTRLVSAQDRVLSIAMALAAIATHDDVHALTFLVGSDGACDSANAPGTFMMNVGCALSDPETIQSLGRVACATDVNGCNFIANNINAGATHLIRFDGAMTKRVAA